MKKVILTIFVVSLLVVLKRIFSPKPNLRDEIEVNEFNHVAIVVWKIAVVMPSLYLKGWRPIIGIIKHTQEGRNLITLTHPNISVRLEVLEPSGPGSYLVSFLRKFGSGSQHHITFYINKDLRKVRQILLARGIRLHSAREYEIVIHPESGGTMIQFFSANRRLGRASGGGEVERAG